MGKKGGGNLGRQLARTQTSHRKKPVSAEGYLHTAELQDGYDWGRMNLKSVTEEASYIDFLNTAEQSRRDFDSEKWNVKLLDAQTRQVYIDTDKNENGNELRELTEEEKVLPIPRRPAWTGLSPTELNDAENAAFLEWRRGLASLQEESDAVITPYEKNLEFWRQLWRVIERSDLIIQIVDCRNPLLFRSSDMEKYVTEVSALKKNMILLNKADYLTTKQREQWASWMKDNIGSTRFAFFSAIQEDEEDEEDSEAGFDDVCEVLTSQRLLQLFRTFKRHESENLTVGFTGYPNVGKSSSINKLLNSKKVRVSETPGKTKHFQTLVLADDITLCDCPGLVMPSVVASKADMVLNGILPVDQLRDHVPSMLLMLQHIPTHFFEFKYGMVLPQEPEILSVEEVLTALAMIRGFMAVGGRADQSRAARVILKDYVSGKLCYCLAPPGLNQDEFHVFIREERRIWHSEEAKEMEARRLQQAKKTKTQDMDDKFFANMSLGAHTKGVKLTGRLSDKNKRKTKTRIVYKDLDPKHAY